MGLPLNSVQPADAALRAEAANALRRAGVQPARPASAGRADDVLRREAAAALRAAGVQPNANARSAQTGNAAPGAEALTAPPTATTAQPERVRNYRTAQRIDAVQALLPVGPNGGVVNSPEARAALLAVLPSEAKRTPGERALADLYEGRIDDAAFQASWGERLRAEQDADRAIAERERLSGGRPIDPNETLLEQAGRAAETGLYGVRSAVLETAGQGLRAVGLDGAGDAVLSEADQLSADARAIPVGAQTLDNRARIEALANENVPTTLPTTLFGQYGGTGPGPNGTSLNPRGDANATARAFLVDPLGTARGVANDVAESAPSTAVGLAATYANPYLGAAFYSALGTGQQLQEAATGADGQRREVGARAGAAAVASGVASALFETAADKANLSIFLDALDRSGLDDAAKRSVAQEVGAYVRSVAAGAAEQAPVEAGTEGFQTGIQNIGARYGWDPDRRVTDGLARSVLIGGASGFAFGGGGAAVGSAAGRLTNTPSPDAETVSPSAAVAPRAEPVSQAAAAPEVAAAVAPEERVVSAAPAPAELTPAVAPEVAQRVARIEAALPLVPEAQRSILEAELARLTAPADGRTDAATPAAPAAGEDASAVDGGAGRALVSPVADRPVAMEGAASAEETPSSVRFPRDAGPLPTQGVEAGAAVDAGGTAAGDGRPAVADQAVTPAPTGPKRRINRGMNAPVYVRFEDPLHAALYDYGSSIGSRSGRNPTAGQKAKGERRAALIEMGVPEGQVEALARAEYDAVRETAKAGADDTTLTPRRLYRPDETAVSLALPARPTGQPVTRYLGENAAALREAAAAEMEANADLDWETDAYAAEAEAMRRASESTNPAVLIDAWQAARERENGQAQNADAAIATHLPTMSRDQLAEANVSGTDAGKAGRAYFRAGRDERGNAYLNAEEAAQRVSDESGVPVTADDVLGFVARYSSGPSEYRARLRDTRRAIEGQFKNVTGEPLTEKRAARYTAALNAETAGPVPVEAAPTGYGSENRGVSRDAYEAARAALRASAGDLFSNPLPSAEVLRAWGQIAAFHVEAGAREFATFAGRMIADAGEAVRPRLRELYDEALRTVQAPAVSEPAAQPSVDDILNSVESGAPSSSSAPSVAPSVDDLLSQYAPENATPGVQATPEAESPDPSLASLTKAQGAAVRERLGLDKLTLGNRRTWQGLLDHVLAEDLDLKAEIYLSRFFAESQAGPRVVEGAAPLTDLEHVAVVVAEAKALVAVREAQERAERYESEGNSAAAMEAEMEVMASLAKIDRLTEGADRSGSEAGRALAARRIGLRNTDTDAIEIAPALSAARRLKGGALTAVEREAIRAVVDTATQASAKEKALQAKVDAETEARATEVVTGVAPTRGEVREARRIELRSQRDALSKKLAGLMGRQLNSGVDPQTLRVLGQIALTHAKEQALNLDGIIERVLTDHPQFSRRDVAEAIAMPKRAPGRTKTEEQLDRAKLERRRAVTAVREAQRALSPKAKGITFSDIATVPRSIMATGDLSSLGNQGAILSRAHPIIGVRMFFRSLANLSDDAAALVDEQMRADPLFEEWQAMGGYHAPVGDAINFATPTAMEEQFRSRFFEKAPWIKRALVGAVVGSYTMGPGVGTAVGAAGGVASKAVMSLSENQFALFLNGMRFEVYKHYVRSMPDADNTERRHLARGLNLATGRGELGRAAPLAEPLSNLFFAPKLWASRFQYPFQLVKKGVPRRARIVAARQMGAFIAVTLFLQVMADIGDDETEQIWDPRSPDVGRLARGKARIDIWGGNSANARLAARIVLAATDARGLTDRPRSSREIDILTEIGRNVSGKKAPWIGLTLALMTGKDFRGQPVTIQETIREATTPITAMSIVETLQNGGQTEAEKRENASIVGTLNFLGSSAYTRD